VPGNCTDELVLVRWQPSATGELAAVGVLVDNGDDVVTLPSGAAAGAIVTAPGLVTPVRTLQAIPPGHKLAVRPIAAGAFVKKYGQPIGRAVAAIAVGEHVHVHNVVSARAGGAEAGQCGKGGDLSD